MYSVTIDSFGGFMHAPRKRMTAMERGWVTCFQWMIEKIEMRESPSTVGMADTTDIELEKKQRRG